jgi:ATP-dependent RNA helicase SrmB
LPAERENVFEDLQLDRQLRLGIDALELTTATEVQQLAVPPALEGKDLLVSAETGSGKTLAYLIPLSQKILAAETARQTGTLALILVPTRELARQVLKQCRELLALSPLKAQAITGGADFEPLITDDFILLPLKGLRMPGATIVVEFTASRL